MAENTKALPQKFRVEIDGVTPHLKGWLSVSGLEVRHEVSRYYDDHNETPRTMGGKTRVGPLILTRALDTDRALYQWANQGAKQLRNGAIIFLDYAGNEAFRSNWFNGWVTRWYIDEMKVASSTETVQEVVEISIEDIKPG